MAVAGVAGLCVRSILKIGDFYRFLCEFRLALITPEQLRSKLIAGKSVLLFDLQGGERQCQGLMGIPGAVRIDPRQLCRYGRQYRHGVTT